VSDPISDPLASSGSRANLDPGTPGDEFDAFADSYDSDCLHGIGLSGESRGYFAEGRVRYLTAWWSRTGRPRPGSILDYGCGTGGGTAVLAAGFPGARVHGVDPSSRCIENAAVSGFAGDMSFGRIDPDCPLPTGAADLVYLSGVVHHVAPPDRPALFAELRRLVAPGGIVAVFENNPLNPGTRWVMARIPFDRDASPLTGRETRQRLRDARFDVLQQGYLFYFPRFLRLLRPAERFLTRLPLGAQYAVFATPGGPAREGGPGAP
jgi:SAM-dependent methyltransferase